MRNYSKLLLNLFLNGSLLIEVNVGVLMYKFVSFCMHVCVSERERYKESVCEYVCVCVMWTRALVTAMAKLILEFQRMTIFEPPTPNAANRQHAATVNTKMPKTHQKHFPKRSIFKCRNFDRKLCFRINLSRQDLKMF